MKRIIKAFIRAEDGGYVVECPDVHGVTQGDTLDEAIANLREVIDLALEDEAAEYGLAPEFSVFAMNDPARVKDSSRG